MNWLITGGCGFIGTRLVQQVIAASDCSRIRVMDNLGTGKRRDLSLVTGFEEKSLAELSSDVAEVELVVADITDEAAVSKVMQGIDVIVHLAANTGVGPSVEDPRSDCINNIIGTFNLLDAARINNVNRFVFASSGAPVGEVVPPIHEELPVHPVSPYGASKLAGEGYCSAYYRSFGINTVSLRFGNVYGPGSLHKNSVVAKFIRLAIFGEPLEIYGDGSQTRDFIYIDDLIEAILLASKQAEIGGEVFQIASNSEVTINELVTELLEALESRGIGEVEVINGETRLGDVKRNYSDTKKAKMKLGWVAKTSLQQGLETTVDYFLA